MNTTKREVKVNPGIPIVLNKSPPLINIMNYIMVILQKAMLNAVSGIRNFNLLPQLFSLDAFFSIQFIDN